MSTKTETEASSGIDLFKWLITAALIVVAVVGNSFYGEEAFLYRLIGVLVVAVIAALVASQTVKGKAFVALLKDARAEVKRVVWPTKQETLQTTMIVVAVVAFMAIVLWLLDLGLGALSKMIIG
ncbi:preprotein translocase subunit SecE [Gammaproteobacteria bacterium 45_16_T64]|nr:preprotein translocase subunit SecE [Gammaproteobacteria bacterium 45_16_T64]